MKSLASFVRNFRLLALAFSAFAIVALPQIAAAQNIVVRGNSRIDGDSIRQYFVPAPASAWIRRRSIRA